MKPFEILAASKAVALRLHGDLTVENARELHTALSGLLDAAHALTIDAAHLTRLDGAALQVLIAASRAANGVTVVARSDAWDEAFRRYALEHSDFQSPSHSH